MRISDWSSDVCSSDLRGGFGDPRSATAQAELNRQLTQVTRTRDASLESLKKKSGASAETLRRREIRDDISYSEEERRARHRLLDAMQKTEIGRASCRERVCQYV